MKLFGNLELRTHLTRFNVWGRHMQLGVATFFDAGRLWWAIDQSRPDLDGTGLGLHWGAGGGLRLQQGRAFLVRADVAWSPDARPVGGYLLADHIFEAARASESGIIIRMINNRLATALAAAACGCGGNGTRLPGTRASASTTRRRSRSRRPEGFERVSVKRGDLP